MLLAVVSLTLCVYDVHLMRMMEIALNVCTNVYSMYVTRMLSTHCCETVTKHSVVTF